VGCFYLATTREQRSGSFGEAESFGKIRSVVRAHELVAVHGDRHFERPFGRGFLAAEDLAEASNADGRVATGKGDQILDPATDGDFAVREKADSARTDIAGFFDAVQPLIAQLQDVQGQLQLVSLCTSLFQNSTLVLFALRSNPYRYLFLLFEGEKPVGIAARDFGDFVVNEEFDGDSAAVCLHPKEAFHCFDMILFHALQIHDGRRAPGLLKSEMTECKANKVRRNLLMKI